MIELIKGYKFIIDGEDVWKLRTVCKFAEEMALKLPIEEDEETLKEIREWSARVHDSISNERFV